MEKILIVDDDRSYCRQLKVMLEVFGYSAGFILNPEILFLRLSAY